MINTMTNQPMRVFTEGTAGPYILLPFTQVDEVRRHLDSRGIRHWLEDDIISINGGPETAVINFGREGDAVAVQAILDSVL